MVGFGVEKFKISGEDERQGGERSTKKVWRDQVVLERHESRTHVGRKQRRRGTPRRGRTWGKPDKYSSFEGGRRFEKKKRERRIKKRKKKKKKKKKTRKNKKNNKKIFRGLKCAGLGCLNTTPVAPAVKRGQRTGRQNLG